MSQLDEKNELREYLLGNLKEVEAIEKRILSDEVYFQQLEMAEDEIIQDFADEKLSAHEKIQFENTFLITKERRGKLNFAQNLRKYIDENAQLNYKPKKKGLLDSLLAFISTPIPVACAVLLIAGMSGYFVFNHFNNRSEILFSLNKVYKNERPTEGRITDFEYAPKIEGTRGEKGKTENLDLNSAKLKATEAVIKNQTAENYHELGRVYLAEINYDEAIINFEKGIKKNPNIAKLRNDLGVALMEKSRLNKAENSQNEKLNKNIEETKPYLNFFAKANEEFAKTIELDKNVLEAYFNQAICIGLIGVSPNQTKEAWEQYLKLDASSKWADEAREQLKSLETNKPISMTKEQILQDFLEAKESNDKEKAWLTLSRNREMITGKLIPQQLAFLFVDSKTLGDEAKARIAIDALVFAGKLEEEKSGDLFWQDLANFYVNVSDDKISQLEKAQDGIREGYILAKKLNYESAKKEFENAKTLFIEANNTSEAIFCEYWIGYLTNRLKNTTQSIEVLKTIENTGKAKNYKWLLSHILCWLAINQSEIGETSSSLNYYKEALTYTESTSDTQNQQKILSLIASDYKSLNRDNLALQYLQKSLDLEKLPEASQRQKWRDYESLTKTFFTSKHYNTALVFGKELLNLAFINDDVSFKCDSYLSLGSIYSALKDYDNAIELTKKGLEAAKLLNTEEERLLETATANLYLGNLEKQEKNYSEALNYYQNASEFFDSTTYQIGSYSAHKGKLFCYLELANNTSFQDELPIVFKLFENNRTKILEEQNRNSFFENEQDIYDLATEYEFQKENFANAFDYAEESRSRSLLDIQNSLAKISTEEKQPEIKFSANFSQPLKLKQIQLEMPENTQLLVYSVMSKKVLIWTVTKDSFHSSTSEIPLEILQEKVTNYADLVSENEEPNEQLNISKELYQILITPIKNNLDSNKQLFVIPDKILFRMPFVTLYSDKYLIEDYKISFSPSANVFLNCSRKAKEFDVKQSETLLSVGDPTFNQVEYANSLKPLISAKSEAIEVAKLYANPKILVEGNATKKQIKENLNSANVFHFAGHYVVEEKTPLLSSFVLAGDKRTESNLANHEIIGKKLSNTKLIVLSACDTGIEKYYKGEGMIGASRSFLAINVPLVVASQWSVDSQATKQLMIRFHQLRKTEKISTNEALRQSQLEMLKDTKFRQPYYWAAFASLGGYTRF
jgi:CHAT domain-containing protein